MGGLPAVDPNYGSGSPKKRDKPLNIGPSGPFRAHSISALSDTLKGVAVTVQSKLPPRDPRRFLFSYRVSPCGLKRESSRHRSSVVEHTLGKGEVTGSSPVGGLSDRWHGWSVTVSKRSGFVYLLR